MRASRQAAQNRGERSSRMLAATAISTTSAPWYLLYASAAIAAPIHSASAHRPRSENRR